MKLSILICTLPGREKYLSRIQKILSPQLTDECQVLVDPHPRNQPTGTKRNNLITKCYGEYFCFIDDDDQVSTDYVKQILYGIEQTPDTVTFNGHMTTNGASRVNFTIGLGNRYEERGGIYYRPPNHLCAMKKLVVQHVKFRPIWQQEDYRWCMDLQARKLLKTEFHINKDLYHYDYYPRKK